MKKFGIILTVALVAILMSTQTVASGLTDLPVKNIDGKLFSYYEVQPKETIYSLTHKLDVTVDYIIANNPSVADGLKAHTTLYFPVSEADVAAGAGRKTHTVERGETIYGISRKYGMTTDRLIEMNPRIRDGLKSGMVLLVGTVDAGDATPANTKGHPVKEGETLYSIARQYGVTVAQIEAANPGMTILKAGTVINIPTVDTVKVEEKVTPAGVEGTVTVQTPTSTTIEAVEPPLAQETVTEPVAEVVAPEPKRGETRVAVMLPFMLSQSKMPRAASRMLEFYKGFLLAVDSMRASGDAIKLYTYDTGAAMDSITAQLARPEMTGMDVIIAPDDVSQFNAVGEFGRKNNIAVFNAFVVKDSTYVTNPVMMQANIGSRLMYDKAVAAFIDRLNGATPVILTRTGGAADKADFIDELKKRLAAKGIEWKEIKFTGKLASSNLDGIKASGNYVFIPVSGRAAEFSNISGALTALADASLAEGGSVKLWGYPEWITFKGDALSNIQKLDTRIYSRFASEADSFDAARVRESFKNWFGGEPTEAVPSQALLGFDVGMFVLKALNANPTGLLEGYIPSYQGAQNSYRFSHREGEAGLQNDALYIVNFRPGGFTESTLLP